MCSINAGINLTTHAAENDVLAADPDAYAFFEFVTGPERMESNGDFRFSFHSYLTPLSRFKPNNQSIEVWVAVWLRDINETPQWSDPWFPPKDASKSISVSLYEAGGGGRPATFIDSFSANADDKKTTHTFTGLDVTKEYYLTFEGLSTLGTHMNFDGKGNVSDVTVTKH